MVLVSREVDVLRCSQFISSHHYSDFTDPFNVLSAHVHTDTFYHEQAFRVQATEVKQNRYK